jgi:NAD-dependent deacetylase
MTRNHYDEQIKRAATLFKQSKSVVTFSGAGISTDSGIPDFRSGNSGLWENIDPFAVASIYGFKRNPQAFYDWVRPLAQKIHDAQPNPAHTALGGLEKLGYMHSIITQNIDTLHTDAGNQTIYELHGHLRKVTCIQCFAIYAGDPIIKKFMQDGHVPRCPQCQGVIKPNVILFGEQLPIQELLGAQQAARKCDLMLIVGSSLEVAPANQLPLLAQKAGAHLIIINLTPTHLDSIADVVIHAHSSEVLPKIVIELEKLL